MAFWGEYFPADCRSSPPLNLLPFLPHLNHFLKDMVAIAAPLLEIVRVHDSVARTVVDVVEAEASGNPAPPEKVKLALRW